MTTNYTNGIGDSVGDQLATCKPLLSSGNIWFCDFVTGVDAASPAGQSREVPLKTLAQAVVNAADGDIVVLLRSETIATSVVLSKRLTILGSGVSGALPAVQLIPNLVGSPMLSVTVSFVELRNLLISECLAANTTARIALSSAATDFTMVDCYVRCNGNDEGPALSIAASMDRPRIVTTTFISTASSRTNLPESAVKTLGVLSDPYMSGVVFSGGAYGFSNYRAADFNAGAITRARFSSISLLLGADMRLNSASTGRVNVQTCTGASRVDWS